MQEILQECPKIRVAVERECEDITKLFEGITVHRKREVEALKKVCDTKDLAMQSAQVQLQEILQECPKRRVAVERECEDITRASEEMSAVMKREVEALKKVCDTKDLSLPPSPLALVRIYLPSPTPGASASSPASSTQTCRTSIRL